MVPDVVYVVDRESGRIGRGVVGPVKGHGKGKAGEAVGVEVDGASVALVGRAPRALGCVLPVGAVGVGAGAEYVVRDAVVWAGSVEAGAAEVESMR